MLEYRVPLTYCYIRVTTIAYAIAYVRWLINIMAIISGVSSNEWFHKIASQHRSDSYGIRRHNTQNKSLLCFLYIVHIIEHGIAQHSGKQTGTTAAPDLLELFDLLPDSYS